MTSYRIALLPGDGIGPECMDAARLVLEGLVDRIPELNLKFTPHRAGAELYRETGETLPAAVLEDCLEADAVLLSAIGLPDVRQPDGTEVQPTMMVELRRALGLHSAVRPVKLFPGALSVLRDTGAGIDFVILRENLEGLFASVGGGSRVGNEVATDTLVITRQGYGSRRFRLSVGPAAEGSPQRWQEACHLRRQSECVSQFRVLSQSLLRCGRGLFQC